MNRQVQQVLDREATLWKIISLNNLTQVCDMLGRGAEGPVPNDYLLRDVYFANVLKVPSNSGQPTFIQHAKESFQMYKNKQYSVQKKIQEDKYLKRRIFWRHLFWLRPKNSQQSKSRDITRRTAYSVMFVPMVCFVFSTLLLYKVTGISKLSAKTRFKGIALCAFFATMWTNFKLSDQIFTGLPELPDRNFQLERQHLLADSTLSQGLFLAPLKNREDAIQSAQETIRQTSDPVLRRLLLQREGFTVFE